MLQISDVLRASCSLNMCYVSVCVCEADGKPGLRLSLRQCLHNVCLFRERLTCTCKVKAVEL